MGVVIKLIFIPVLYYIFVRVLKKHQTRYRTAVEKILKNIFKPAKKINNGPLFIVYTLQLSLIALVFFIIPYFDRPLLSLTGTEFGPVLRNLDLGLVLVSLCLLSLFEYFGMYLDSGGGKRREHHYGITIMTFCLIQFSMMYLYGTMALEDTVVNQQVSELITLVSYGFVRNPFLFLSSLLITLIYFQNLQNSESAEGQSSLSPIKLFVRELIFLCMCLLVVYLYLGGHGLPLRGEFVNNFFPIGIKVVLQAFVLLIKTLFFAWCVVRISKRLVHRTEFFQSKLVMTLVMPLILMGMVFMPVLQYWSQL